MKRKTRQYRAIMEVLEKTRDHPSADVIYERVRRVLPNISLATIYRNLKAMVQEGVVLEIKTRDEDKARFDGTVRPHYHFKCLNCGKLMDLHNVPYDPDLDARVGRAEGLEVMGHQTVFYGICKDCQKKRA